MAASKFQSRNGKFPVFGFESDPTAAGRSQAQKPPRPTSLELILLRVSGKPHIRCEFRFIAMLGSLLSRLKSSVLDLKGILPH